MGAHELSVDPSSLRAAASEMDAFADRLQTSLARNRPALTVVPAGADEVSRRVATTFTEFGDQTARETGAAVEELRGVAATLRSLAASYDAADDTTAAAMRA